MNERRRDAINRIESTGAKVVLFDSPLYGPERDRFIKQAKCVFNAHFYHKQLIRAGACVACRWAPQWCLNVQELANPHVAFRRQRVLGATRSPGRLLRQQSLPPRPTMKQQKPR